MTIKETILSQLSQKSTVVAIVSAVALLVGWHAAPEKLEAISTVLATVDSIVLAVIQERTKGI